jgi:hypothetical protein
MALKEKWHLLIKVNNNYNYAFLIKNYEEGKSVKKNNTWHSCTPGYSSQRNEDLTFTQESVYKSSQ